MPAPFRCVVARPSGRVGSGRLWDSSDNGTPAARPVRKAAGLTQTEAAGLPKKSAAGIPPAVNV
jgi:hypothetical protein